MKGYVSFNYNFTPCCNCFLIKPLPTIPSANFSLIFWCLLGICFTESSFGLCLWFSLAEMSWSGVTQLQSHLWSMFKTNTFFYCWNSSNTIYHDLLHYRFRISFRIKRWKRMPAFIRTSLLLLYTLTYSRHRRNAPTWSGKVYFAGMFALNSNKNNLLGHEIEPRVRFRAQHRVYLGCSLPLLLPLPLTVFL